MAKIDLLPWREARREKRNKDFKATLVLVAILSSAVVFAGFQYFKGAMQAQNARNAYLQKETTALDVKIREIQKLKELRSELIDRMELIQALQGLSAVWPPKESAMASTSSCTMMRSMKAGVTATR